MLAFLRVVIPALQTQPDMDVGALREEVVKEQVRLSDAAQAMSSQQANESVTETSSPTPIITE